MESGKAKLNLVPVSPQSLITRALEPFTTAYRNAGVELVTHVDDDVPDVQADTTRILHVFSNLLSNALKFSSSGKVVTLTAESESDAVRFSVIDQGTGIPSDQLSRVFERFFRAESSERNGAGLGLAIAKDIVEAHGGRISVQSVQGYGSTFSFTLHKAEVTANIGRSV
jgi:NtrC-family two-component system sensor histidine kinase KinB